MELKIDRDSLKEAQRRLDEQIKKHGSQLAFAEHFGLNHSLISQVVRGRIDPPPAVLAALGLARVVRYEDTKSKR